MRSYDYIIVGAGSAMPDLVSAHINAYVLMMSKKATALIRATDATTNTRNEPALAGAGYQP